MDGAPTLPARTRTRRGLRPTFTTAVAALGVTLLVIAGIVMVAYNERAYREGKVQQADAQARILASTVAAALVFDDREAAREYVNALAVDDAIQVAAVYDARGSLFASYTRAGHVAPAGVHDSAAAFGDDQLAVTIPVVQGTRIGTVYLQTLVAPLVRRLERYGAITLLVLMAALLFVLLGASQRRLATANDRLERQGEDLATTNERLRAQIAQREEAEMALRQAQKMEAIGQLTGGIAHDFNNLLQVILGNLQALQRRRIEDGDETRRMILAATRGAERAASLTQRLLAFSRRQPLNPRPLDINRLVTSMSELLHRTLGEAVRIETVLASDVWRVDADANQLENALLNLAVNARDAMPRGGKLTIETANASLDQAYADTHDARPGQYVMLAVSDTGTGMPREVIAKAFEPFFTTKDAGKGSGLGLSQVYGFIRQSGGHARIYSEPGDGTTVKLYLPRLDGAADGHEAITQPGALAHAPTDHHVLVVEDDHDVRAHTVAMLRELGYAVVDAADGNSALQALDARPAIGLLFTDVGLPGGMNGRQLADEARRRRPDLRVLFTTGYARNAIVHQGRLDPGVELITKPFTYDELAAKLHAMLR
ncbi:MAG TPA: ATP-binding protein [Casimicrobiaceae bacterium]|nr:ATP-binding protein [Casimicrobiaceae bacterium]